MDCNWCAVCSKHFHSDHQTSLYCSQECRKADALACCAFHDCADPDGSAHHDHLTFCHHHRPAIQIPALPLMKYSHQQHKPAYHSRHQRNPAIVAKHAHYETPSTDSERTPAATPCDMDHCGQACASRKNKVLPPPTLSPILPPKISNPASLCPTGTRCTPQLSRVSGHSDDGPLSHAWPSMDKVFFPDHCCRTSACTPTQPGSTARSNTEKGGGNTRLSRSKTSFVSELPPPPAASTAASRGPDGCMALSASIWGTGWRQVEPLPASFVKTVQRSKMLWAGCEAEQCHDKQSRQGRTHGRRRHSSASDASLSSRLPRSLQFIDRVPSSS